MRYLSVSFHTVGLNLRRSLWSLAGLAVAGAGLAVLAMYAGGSYLDSHGHAQIVDRFAPLFLLLAGIFSVYYTVTCVCTYHERRWALVLIGRRFRRTQLALAAGCAALLIGFGFYVVVGTSFTSVLGLPIQLAKTLPTVFLTLLGYVELATVVSLAVRRATRAYLVLLLLILVPYLAMIVMFIQNGPGGVSSVVSDVLTFPLPRTGRAWPAQLAYAVAAFAPIPWLSSRYFLRYE